MARLCAEGTPIDAEAGVVTMVTGQELAGDPPRPGRLEPAPLREEDVAPVAGPAGADAEAHAAAIVTRSKTSFAAGMRILSKPRRRAMYAVYAFARLIDDIADGDWPEPRKRALLDAWRDEIARVYDGAPVSLVGQELARAAPLYELPRDEFLLLIDGMEMDGGAPIVAPSLETLRSYTRRVAGAVGMLSMRCFGAWVGPPSERFALSLGDALQFTNILRDVEEDAEMGRLYLPRELLERHGVSTTDPAAAASDPNLTAVCAELGAMARAKFDAARAEFAAHSRTRLAPALMMMGVYEGYLDLMDARGFRRESGPVALSSLRKAALGLRYAIAPPTARRA